LMWHYCVWVNPIVPYTSKDKCAALTVSVRLGDVDRDLFLKVSAKEKPKYSNTVNFLM